MLAHVRSRGFWQGYVLDPAGAKRLRLTMSGSHFTAIDRGMRLLETRARCRVSHAFSEWAQLCVSTKHPNVNPELMVCGLPSSSHALAGGCSNVYATLFCPPLPQLLPANGRLTMSFLSHCAPRWQNLLDLARRSKHAATIRANGSSAMQTFA